ncbi:Thiol-disulfide isomerase or thioredoxin [Ferrimonas sediminum]|uniref:Thiol-disulfide isomerase or thioredoxin n=1 Tax=Ferrimonas sediminum TaxID=718193 RepID=A0A1G8VIS7_9GAMM|nr:TlpA disulfide reductase family protein [Ferrimonas sediminum]SDJ65225.1 Thiol-disulfide isomerase or thioredoxin [Ferrimonas sediminum]
MIKRQWVIQGAQLAVMVLLALWLGGWIRSLMMVPVSDQMPAITLPELSRQQGQWQPSGHSSDISRGGHRLVYLFAPWCAICEVTFPHLAQWQQQGKNVVPVALSYTSLDEVSRFLTPFADQAPEQVLLGSQELSRYLDVVAYPTYLIVDEHGTVISKRVGYMPEWLLSLYLNLNGI